jgi:hypothetical protein
MSKSTQPAASIHDLRFGTELELVVKSKSKSKNHATFDALANEVSAHLTAAKVKNHVADLFAKDDEKYTDWSVVDEISITTQRKEYRCE